MSLKAWKEKYLIKLDLRNATVLEMLKAAERKWIGLSKENLKKFNLIISFGTSLNEKDDERKSIGLGENTCYLCKKYADYNCNGCPLDTLTSVCNCCGGGWNSWIDFQDNKKMLSVIRKAIKKEMRKAK